MFTKVLALELAGQHVNVNCIAPGLITVNSEASPVSPEYVAALTKQIPWGRAGEPIDIAHAALFLASPYADYMTGEVLAVNGGTSAGRAFLAPQLTTNVNMETTCRCPSTEEVGQHQGPAPAEGVHHHRRRRQAEGRQGGEQGGAGQDRAAVEMTIKGKAYIAGVFEHPTRKADDPVAGPAPRGVGQGRAGGRRPHQGRRRRLLLRRRRARAWAACRWPTTWG